jgi:exonuclease SbcC
MLIKKLYLKNIRSYKEATIELPKGSTLLIGDIGSGKTSILLALEFALFGLQPSQKGNSLMRSNEEEAEVRIEMDIEGKEVIIERKLKRTSKSINQTETSITINNQKFEGSVTEIKNKILEILSYPQEFSKKTNDLYRFTVYTPQEEMKQIILETNDARLNTLRHIFGIDKYKRIEENIAILCTRLRQEIKARESGIKNSEQKNLELIQKEDMLKSSEERAKSIEGIIISVRNEKENRQKEMQVIQENIDKVRKLSTEKEKSQTILESKTSLILSINREIKSIEDEISKISREEVKDTDIRQAKERLFSLEKNLEEKNNSYIVLCTEIQSAESNIKNLDSINGKISLLNKCPTCLQIVQDEYKNNIVQKAKEEISTISKSINENSQKKSLILTEVIELKKEIENKKDYLRTVEIKKLKLENLKEKEKRLETLLKEKNSINSDMDLIKKHLESLSTMIKEQEIFKTQYESLSKSLNEIVQRESASMIKRAEINKEIQFFQQQIHDLKKELSLIEEEKKKLTNMKEAEFWISGKFMQLVLYTEKAVMTKLREEFSRLFSDWFSMLVSDTLSVRIDESFSPIVQQQDYEVDYAYLSGGERTAVALAYRLALNQVINSLLSTIKTRDLVILDEPTDGFSDAQLDKIREVLRQMKVQQLIIVSHEQKVEGFVDNIIRFKKVLGVTEIEETLLSQ